MRQVTVQDPITGILGVELNIPGLRHSEEHSVPGLPGRLWNPPPFGRHRIERVAVEMDRVMVHAHVDHANPHTLSKLYE